MPSNESTQHAAQYLSAEVLAESASLTDIEVAKLLSCSTSALRNARAFKKGVLKDLPYHKIGRSVRYSLKDVLCFQNKFRIDPQADQ